MASLQKSALWFFCFFALSSFAQTVVQPTGATPIVPSNSAGDVAIFPNPVNINESRLIGTDSTQNGLFSFTLDGGPSEFLSLGPLRGVDVKTRLGFRSAPKALLFASATLNGQFLFGLNDAGVLFPVLSRPMNIAGVNAVALYAPADGGLEALVDVGTGIVRRFAFIESAAMPEKLDWFEHDAGLSLPRAPNSLVVDSRQRKLYASVITDGIYGWSIDGTAAPALVEPTDGGALTGPPTGLTLYPLYDGGTLLLVAIPAHDEYLVYQGTEPALTQYAKFQIGKPPVFVTFSKYLDVSKEALPGYPAGMLAVSDQNSSSGARYQMVRWDFLADASVPKLPIEYLVAGAGDGGTDAGPSRGDGGVTDGGSTDGGRVDAGPGPGTGGGRGGGAGGGTGGGGGGTEINKGCCAGAPADALLPGFAFLLFARRFKRRRSR